MSETFTMPTLGQSMEEGTVLQWFRQEGDPIKKGEPLLEVMSDKANFEVESPIDGVLHKILVAADGTVPINTPIAVLGAPGEAIDSAASAPASGAEAVPAPASAAAPAPAPQAAAAVASVPAPAAAAGAARPFLSPRARRLADERGVPTAALAGLGSGPEGRVLEKDVLSYLESAVPAPAGETARPRVTPLAARIADDLGVNVQELATGLPGSRITADDVRRRAETARPAPVTASAAPAPPAAPPAAPASAPPAPAGGPAVAQVIPFRGLRKIIADNVARSRQTAPHVTLTLEVDMTEATALYKRLQPEIQRVYNTKLTFTDLLIKAAARALIDHPLCNAALIGDEIRVYGDRNIGVAVAAEHGLIVPVIRNADTRPLGEISVELKALAERSRSGRQTAEDLAGGTFTITNLGAFGIDVFDPIIVPPQACILGVGRIADKPVVVEKAVVVRPMMNLCLSFDHRVLDGVPAARLLQRLKELLESPLLLFI